MKEIEISAGTIEDAVAEGLARLGLSRDEVEIEVVEEPRQGVFGIGSKPALVKIRVDEPDEEIMDLIEDTLMEFLSFLDPDADVRVFPDEDRRDAYICDIDTDLAGIVLGRRGRTLDALQILTAMAVSKKAGSRVLLTLDSGGFREKRIESLEGLARSVAREVIETGEEIDLDPMSPHDRRIIHMELSGNKDVATESHGKGSYRHVVVKPVERRGRPRRRSGGGRRRSGGSGRGRGKN